MGTHQTLTDAQVAGFIEDGYVKLEEAVPRSAALAAQDFLWDRLAAQGVRRDDPATWAEPMVHLKEVYADDVFQACQTPRLTGAIEDLVGRDRWAGKGRPTAWGWWPVNFAVGADKPWTVPTGGWHWDGIQFRHYVDSPDQGLLLLPMFSETGPRGGGTLIAAGSHRPVARLLARHPDGLEIGEAIALSHRTYPWLAELAGKTKTVPDRVAYFMDESHPDDTGQPLRVVEATASPGDVYLCHPFLFHAASQNHSGVPRFMCNRTTSLTGRMNVRALTLDSSPVEISIHQALSEGN